MRMGVGPPLLQSPFSLWSTPHPPSPPSNTRRPPPPPLRQHRLPPPPPPVWSHLSLPCSALPLPPRCPPPPGAVRMPLWFGTTIDPDAAAAPVSGVATSGRDLLCCQVRGGGGKGIGGRFVDHLPPVTSGGMSRDEGAFAGVPPEMLPPKKRLLRYHPYAAAWTTQEMANHVRGEGGGFGAGRTAVRPAVEEGHADGLRAELLRLRISRPDLVLTKRLTPSDRSRERARLVLPEGMVRSSPLLGMLTAGERHLVLSGEGGGLPVPAFDRLGRAYRMALKRDRVTRRTYRLTGQWSLFVSRHAMHDGDAVEVRAFRPPAWQVRLESHGEGGLGMALLLRRCRVDQPAAAAAAAAVDGNGKFWSYRERGAADGLLLLARAASPPRQDGDGDLQITAP